MLVVSLLTIVTAHQLMDLQLITVAHHHVGLLVAIIIYTDTVESYNR